MPIPTTELGKRLMRWQLAHTAPAPLSLDHPVQVDLAEAADEIESLSAANEELVRGMTEMAGRFTRAMDGAGHAGPLGADDAMTAAKAMAKSRRLVLDFDRPFPPDSAQDRIYTEALRVVTALKAAHEN